MILSACVGRHNCFLGVDSEGAPFMYDRYPGQLTSRWELRPRQSGPKVSADYTMYAGCPPEPWSGPDTVPHDPPEIGLFATVLSANTDGQMRKRIQNDADPTWQRWRLALGMDTKDGI